jgi:hypothetical protein
MNPLSKLMTEKDTVSEMCLKKLNTINNVWNNSYVYYNTSSASEIFVSNSYFVCCLSSEFIKATIFWKLVLIVFRWTEYERNPTVLGPKVGVLWNHGPQFVSSSTKRPNRTGFLAHCSPEDENRNNFWHVVALINLHSGQSETMLQINVKVL